MPNIGNKQQRVDGPLKVSGQATYTADIASPFYHAYVLQSSIACGSIMELDTSAAEAFTGVKAIFTHKNLPERLKNMVDYTDPLSPPGTPFRPFYNDKILYNGQPIALVVAETFEQARYASRLIKVTYEQKEFKGSLEENLKNASADRAPEPASNRGDFEKAFKNSDVSITQEYRQSRNYHNPMEPHATSVVYKDDGSIVVYDKIQGVASSLKYLNGVFGLAADKVQVKSDFVGGAFGSGLRPQYQLFMATLASLELKHNVQMVMTRAQMFSFGYRPEVIHTMKLGCSKDGTLQALSHHTVGETSTFEDFNETIVDWSGLLYKCENVNLEYKLTPVQSYTPLDMRAPGGVSGVYALECAMDDLAHKAGIDPLEFRRKNYVDYDQNEDKPFTSKELRACYDRCEELFGWKNRKDKTTNESHVRTGFGMATGSWEALQQKASVSLTMDATGKFTLKCATADIGTGTYTVMSQIAADKLGVPLDHIDFKLGDTAFPDSPIEGGSWTVSSVGSAVAGVCKKFQYRIADVWKRKYPDYQDAAFEDITFEEGNLEYDSKSFSFTEIMQQASKEELSISHNEAPAEGQDTHSGYAHCCVMVEVSIDKELGVIKVPRITNVSAAGKIINPKTAENQLLGAMVWGLGMALREEGMVDTRYGRVMNANFAEYHIAVNADVHDVHTEFVEEKDDKVNPLGAKGVGELGIVGLASAISNAIFDATGKRLTKLPMLLDDVLEV
ncbi:MULTISPECIES: xanthine dehydrogenase family protein molybdopterin-binding subunit [unclassified Leeuwenhoekiella]|uniref:xanthine dehydrogenase family protein molybdopterin-binding subunit n=1 Tax=unclassified Leeuwenhoekiella TaxID=2615029 RepID=UPI000C36DE04|nr:MULTISPECIES: xanthine dehydrogenase family protein molybdopterin-binding subunit [unclassified Leeuwenhoekiella]MAW94490.1 aldehyde oxidase [Leeuwenhoekiella sp.]MAW96986.1 aldehyde oxidase [Leeuwenhoekiella sp.]MBA81168.1 aldehyde oxidase [Leeuwenhoekiella sp.]|tara:strand:- start:529 stop:2718 length:2190 start_codon:yes stop_codon:yes gene_type:complete